MVQSIIGFAPAANVALDKTCALNIISGVLIGETKMKFKYEMASTATTSIIEIETKNLKQAYDKAAEKLGVPLDTVYALGAKPCH